MNNPLTEMPEIRATFEADAKTLLRVATEQLMQLNHPGTDFAASAGFRNSIHSLRGAAAMIGAEPLTKLVDDFERLAEVAESFKLTAREKAQGAYAFLQNQFENLWKCVQSTLRIEPVEARNLYESVHDAIMRRWGDYFYTAVPDNGSSVAHKPAPKPEFKNARGKSARRADPDLVAREFLSSLGVAPAGPGQSAGSHADQIDPEMLSYFVIETSESLSALEKLLLDWEKAPEDPKIAQSVFRLAHTIKGAANSLGLSQIGKLLHALEDVLETHVVDRNFPRLSELVEIIFGVSDEVKRLVQEAQKGIANSAVSPRVAELIRRIQTIAQTPPPPLRVAQPENGRASLPAPSLKVSRTPELPASAPADAATGATLETASPLAAAMAAIGDVTSTDQRSLDRMESADLQTIRVDSERLDLLMNLIGELVISRSRLEKKLTDISRLKEEMAFGKSRLFQAITDFQGKYEYSNPSQERKEAGSASEFVAASLAAHKQVPTDAGADELGAFSELEFDQYDDFNILARTLMEIGTDTGEIFSQLNRFFDAFGEETGQFSKITARLQDEITRVRMMPLTLLFQRLQRATRDAAKKESKLIEFSTSDNDAKLDKLILDQLYTPLLHVVRNAVSHGIEDRAKREASGKPAAGQINLKAICEANQVVIEVSDDGQGLDLALIRQTAIERGLLTESSVIDDESLTQFIFHPGFSTAQNVTDVSGRGVGLDVVRLEISRLSGSVHVRSVPGQGCTFVIHLPLTLAINQAMFITAGKQTCALPLNFVERIQENHAGDIVRSGFQELVRTPDGAVPLLRMDRLLNVAAENPDGGCIVMARVADRRIAIRVDRILRKQDIVVKPLGPLLRGHPLFSGATLGGHGQVVMIADLPRWLEREHASPAQLEPQRDRTTPDSETDSARVPTVLVVDDSLSVRKVIEKHLVSLKYKVELAVDGLDALEKLRTQAVSIVLTDLEMPRMHGLELIAEMRRHEAFRTVPVIVVTSRDAEKHRRRATAAGANDYIIKPFSREQLAKYISQHLSKKHS